MRSAQPRLLRSSAASSFLMRRDPCSSLRQRDADVAGFGEEAHRLVPAFAAQAGLGHAAERGAQVAHQPGVDPDDARLQLRAEADRKSTRLNSSHVKISSAVFYL